MPATDEQLQQAYDLISKPSWGSLTAAMSDPIRSRIVLHTAWRLANGHDMFNLKPPTQQPPVIAPWTPSTRDQLHHQIDRKRAAAGDRDDD